MNLSAEQFARIRLLRTPNIGPASYRQLLARFGSAGAALEALPDMAARGGGRHRTVPEGVIAAEVARVDKAGARYLFHDAPDYPPLMARAAGAPPVLIARGDPALATRTPVAVVGARNASAAALKLARMLGADLARAGHAVVSGLARGIDGAAHRAALAAGGAGTVGVIASGIDIAYPPEHAELQEQIAAEGLLLTELPPGTEPTNRHFPARNRIIAAMAAGTVVVEAAPKSGSLITARLAGEFGREVMAVPGSPLDPRALGCNQLIREGAILVQRAEDVIELVTSFHGTPRSTFREEGPLAFDFTEEAAEAADGPAPDPDRIAALLTAAPVAVDELVRLSGAGAGAVQLALIELELAGRLTRHAGGKVSMG
ncbi:MAG: DNA-protecting protein DprA [Proteobacteria bacterium]|nr:DNA-protecting protein DprA [Pseudomonadota bacterium]